MTSIDDTVKGQMEHTEEHLIMSEDGLKPSKSKFMKVQPDSIQNIRKMKMVVSAMQKEPEPDSATKRGKVMKKARETEGSGASFCVLHNRIPTLAAHQSAQLAAQLVHRLQLKRAAVMFVN